MTMQLPQIVQEIRKYIRAVDQQHSGWAKSIAVLSIWILQRIADLDQ